MESHRYIVTLRHDGGTIAIRTNASTQEQALKQVLNYEQAPESAVISIEDKGPVT